jgi:hypothetical protein
VKEAIRNKYWHKPPFNWVGDLYQYARTMIEWGDRQMQKDDYLVGATIFIRGTFRNESGDDWRDFDIHDIPLANMLDEYIIASRSQPQTNQRIVNALPGLYVRSRFWNHIFVIGVLNYGQIVTVLDEGDGWSHIDYLGGYVRTDYLSHIS